MTKLAQIKITRKTVSGPKAPAAKPAPLTLAQKHNLKMAAAKADLKNALAAAKPAAKVETKPTAKPAREVISGEAKITVLAKENPRRAGTLAHKTFSLYRTGATIGEWREACAAKDADPGYLHADIAAGYISVK